MASGSTGSREFSDHLVEHLLEQAKVIASLKDDFWALTDTSKEFERLLGEHTKSTSEWTAAMGQWAQNQEAGVRHLVEKQDDVSLRIARIQEALSSLQKPERGSRGLLGSFIENKLFLVFLILMVVLCLVSAGVDYHFIGELITGLMRGHVPTSHPTTQHASVFGLGVLYAALPFR